MSTNGVSILITDDDLLDDLPLDAFYELLALHFSPIRSFKRSLWKKE